jgi:hypothetical protein
LEELKKAMQNLKREQPISWSRLIPHNPEYEAGILKTIQQCPVFLEDQVRNRSIDN